MACAPSSIAAIPQQPGRVRIFSRTREDVTASFPELAEWFSAVKTPAILDGEILAWDYIADRALPFTSLQPRLSRKRVTAAMRTDAPVVYMAFDLLLAGDDLLLHAPLRLRREQLQAWTSARCNPSIQNPCTQSQHRRRPPYLSPTQLQICKTPPHG